MPRSLEELSDALSADRVWRIKEVSSVLKLARSKSAGPVEIDFYCRGGAVIFYSHWEGFIKRGGSNYLKYIAFQRPAIADMADSLLCNFIQHRIADLTDRNRVIEVADLLLRRSELKPKMNYKNAVDTQSNLSSTVLLKILHELGLGFDKFETKLKLVDSRILAARNPIAHGAKGDVSLDDLAEVGALVIELCAAFKDEVENAAQRGLYLRAP